MNQILNLLSEKVVNALGWTLLHSLWQGALLAIILSLLMLALHRHTSKTRYMVAGGALLLQVLLSAITFDHYYFLPAQATTAQTFAINSATSVVNSAPEAVVSFWSDPAAVSKVYFEQHMPLIVTIWLMGLVLMALRFMGGLAYTQRLRHYKTSPLGEKWQERLAALRQELGMSKMVQLVESGMVKVPMAIGYAKPVILLPVGAVTGLSQAQVEAILAHELAHILRRDYLFNIIQSVIDIVFFYHPAMWWISGVVRDERENCCDDVAVAVCGSNLTYARALAELEAMRMPAGPALAMAFSGKRGTLLSRIKRLVGQQSLRPTFTEGFVAALVLVAGLTAFSYGAMASLKQLNRKAVAEKIESSATPTPAKVTETASSDVYAWEDNETTAYVYKAQDGDGKTRDIVIIKNKKGKVIELYVDGKRIPKKEIENYTDLINQRLAATEKAPKASSAEVKAGLESERRAVAEAERRQSRGKREFEYNFQFYGSGDSSGFAPIAPMPPMPPMAPMAPMPRFGEIAPAPPVPPVPPTPLLGDKKEQKRYEDALKQYEKELARYEAKVKSYEEEILKKYGEGSADRQRYQQEMQRYQQHAQARAEHAAEMAKRHEEMARKHEEMARQQEARMKELKKEMVKDGLIQKDSDKIDIQITKDSFLVNGKKQSQELYEKYKKLLNVNITGEGNFRYQHNTK